MAFGEDLRKLRLSKKRSLKDVAKRSGISHSYISQVETGSRNTPKPEMLYKLAHALDVEYEYMLKLAGVIKEEANYQEVKHDGNAEFGKHIKNLRTDKLLTLEELQMQTGLSKGYLSKLENGNRNTPKPETIHKLADVLGVPYVYLLEVAGYITRHDIEEYIKWK